MKWLALVAVLAGIAPLAGWLRRNPRQASKAWMLMGFLPLTLSHFHLNMALISWAFWPGYVKGFEFSVLDALAIALYFSLSGPRQPLPFRISMALYFIAVLISAVQAEVPLAALFYPWQLARMFLVYAVVTRGSADLRYVYALLTGMGASLFLEAGFAVWERFGLGVLQVGGTLAGQNLLGMLSNMIVMPFFALMLSRRSGWLPVVIVLMGAVVDILTVSRATLGLAPFGFAAVFLLSSLRLWTARKGMILVTSLAIAIVLVPVAATSFEVRFAHSDSGTYDERAAFKAAAAMMFSDHPLGVGANNYVMAANIEGYNEKAGVAAAFQSDATNVHNIYWLVAAETGYPGLITFVFLLLCPLIVAFRFAWRARADQRGDLLLGLGVALLVVYLHSFFEWVFISYQAQYIFALTSGMIAGLAQQLGCHRRPLPRVMPQRPARSATGAVSRLPHRYLTNDNTALPKRLTAATELISDSEWARRPER